MGYLQNGQNFVVRKADGDGGPGDAPVTNLPYTPPTDGGGQTTNPPPSTDGSGGGGSGLPQWLLNQGRNFTGALSNPNLIPGLVTATQQFNMAHQYTDFAERYAGQLDPFGKQRPYYQDLLHQSYSDPDFALNDPAHQRSIQHGLDAVARSQAAKGYLGSGNMMQSMEDYAHTSDDQWLQNYRQGLQGPSGANIGPEASAAMLIEGLRGRMGAENNAVGNLMVPFTNQNARNQDPNNPNNPNNPAGNPTGGNPNGTKPPPINAGKDPQGVMSRLQQAGFNPRDAAQLFQAILSNPSAIDPSTLSLLNSIGVQTPFDQGGVDTAPPTYDPSQGGGIDPSYGMGAPPINSSTGAIMNSGNPITDPNFTGSYGNNIVTGNDDNVDWSSWWNQNNGGGGGSDGYNFGPDDGG
jgi:hypothetical protein